MKSTGKYSYYVTKEREKPFKYDGFGRTRLYPNERFAI